MIILLDLNYTFVGNSLATGGRATPYAQRIGREQYRTDLLELIRGHYVALVTVRDAEYKAMTLDRIRRLCDGWQPEEAYFKTEPTWSPTQWKEHVLTNLMIPRFGDAPGTYLAIESNEENSAMYVRHGVLSLKVWGGQHHGRGRAAPKQESLF